MKAPLLIALALSSSVVFAQKKSATQVAVEQQIARYAQGMHKKDLKTVASVMTPDFRAVSQTGDTTQGAEVLRGIKTLFAQVKKVTLICKVQSLKMVGRNAHLVCHNIMELEVPDPQGNIGTLRSDSTSDELWVPVGGTYKITYSKQLTNKVTLNGRPVKGGG